jgi:hypothetical protein
VLRLATIRDAKMVIAGAARVTCQKVASQGHALKEYARSDGARND